MTEDRLARIYDELKHTALPMLSRSASDSVLPLMTWSHVEGKDLTKGIISKSAHPLYGCVWKLECIIKNTSAEEMFKLLTSSDDDRWVPFVCQSQVHERGEHWAIVQQVAKGMLSISDREMVLIRFSGSNDNHNFYQLWRSVDDDQYPRLQRDSIRGKVLPGGLLIEPVNSSADCRLTYIHNVDLKGKFPKWVVNTSASTFLQKFAQAIQGKAAGLKKIIKN